MTLFAFAVFDKASESFGTPFFDRTPGLAVRGFQDMVNNPDPNNVLSKHPVDFAIYQLGRYEEAIGEFVNDRKKLADAIGLVNSVPE